MSELRFDVDGAGRNWTMRCLDPASRFGRMAVTRTGAQSRPAWIPPRPPGLGWARVDEVLTASALDLGTRFRERSLSPVELVDALAQRIAEVEPRLKAFLELSLDRANEEALQAARAYSRGTARPLEGLPLAVKD